MSSPLFLPPWLPAETADERHQRLFAVIPPPGDQTQKLDPILFLRQVVEVGPDFINRSMGLGSTLLSRYLEATAKSYETREVPCIHRVEQTQDWATASPAPNFPRLANPLDQGMATLLAWGADPFVDCFMGVQHQSPAAFCLKQGWIGWLAACLKQPGAPSLEDFLLSAKWPSQVVGYWQVAPMEELVALGVDMARAGVGARTPLFFSYSTAMAQWLVDETQVDPLQVDAKGKTAMQVWEKECPAYASAMRQIVAEALKDRGVGLESLAATVIQAAYDNTLSVADAQEAVAKDMCWMGELAGVSRKWSVREACIFGELTKDMSFRDSVEKPRPIRQALNWPVGSAWPIVERWAHSPDPIWHGGALPRTVPKLTSPEQMGECFEQIGFVFRANTAARARGSFRGLSRALLAQVATDPSLWVGLKRAFASALSSTKANEARLNEVLEGFDAFLAHQAKPKKGAPALVPTAEQAHGLLEGLLLVVHHSTASGAPSAPAQQAIASMAEQLVHMGADIVAAKNAFRVNPWRVMDNPESLARMDGLLLTAQAPTVSSPRSSAQRRL